MRNRAILAILIAILMMAAAAFSASAAPPPAPEPGTHTALILEELPELAGYPIEPWIMTGYRLLYNVYVYDKDDNVTSEQLVVMDTIGIGEGYLLTQVYSAVVDEEGNVTSFQHTGYRIDHAGIGEFWISLEPFADENSAVVKSGLFKLEKYDWKGEPEDAWYTYLADEEGNADYEYYYSSLDGLLLSLDVYEYDDKDNYTGGVAYKFDAYYSYEAPWLDFGLMEMPEGLVMDYDMLVKFSDGTEAKGVMTFTVEENHFSWAYVTQELTSEDLGNSVGAKIMSEMCTDGLILWLPRGIVREEDEEGFYFDEAVTGSYIQVGGLSEVEGLGTARVLSFVNGYFQAESYFSQETGTLLRYRQLPNETQEFELILTLKGIM